MKIKDGMLKAVVFVFPLCLPLIMASHILICLAKKRSEVGILFYFRYAARLSSDTSTFRR